MAQPRVLILGGSAEAFSLADALAAVPGLDVISSMAGRTKYPRRPAGEVRLGGFGGVAGLAEFLVADGIDAVIDATHPFAHHMTRNASDAGARTGVPVMHFWRPEWLPEAGDNWTEVNDMAAAAGAVTSGDRPVFLTIGSTELMAFADLTDVRLLARIIEPVDPPAPATAWPSQIEFIYDRGPFGYENEIELLRDRDVRCIVTKNSGGDAARAKLDAARELGVPVIMVRRPARPDGEHVATITDAVAWLGRHLNRVRDKETAPPAV